MTTLNIAEWHRFAQSLPTVAMVAVDASRCVQAVSPAAEQLLGRSAAELLGRPLADVFHCWLDLTPTAAGRPGVPPLVGPVGGGVPSPGSLAEHQDLCGSLFRQAETPGGVLASGRVELPGAGEFLTPVQAQITAIRGVDGIVGYSLVFQSVPPGCPTTSQPSSGGGASEIGEGSSREGHPPEYLVPSPIFHDSAALSSAETAALSLAEIAELQQNERRFRELVRAVAEDIWIADSQGQIAQTVEGRAVGHNLNEWMPISQRIASIHPEDQLVVAAGVARALETHEPLRLEIRAEEGREETEWLSILGVPIRGPGGEIKEWVGLSENITERKRAELQLARKNRLLEILAAAAGYLLEANAEDRLRQETLVQLQDAFGIDGHLIYDLTPAGRLNCTAYSGVSPQVVDVLSRLVLQDYPCGQCAMSGRPVMASQADNSPHPTPELLRQLGVRSCLCCPLIVDQQVIGVLSFFSRTHDRIDDDLETSLKTLASFMAVTKRRIRAANLLQDHQAQLKVALAAARMGVWDIDLTTQEIRWSPEVAALFQIDSMPVTFQSFKQFLHPDDIEKCEQAIGDFLGGRSHYFDWRVRQPEGGYHWIGNYLQFVENERGEPCRILGTVQDNAMFKRVEQELLERERHLQEAQRIARLGSYRWEATTDELYWSDELCRLYGIQPRTKLAGFYDFISRVHPDDRERVENRIQQAVQSQSDHYHEFRIILPTGEVRWVTSRSTCIWDADGKLVAVEGTCQDITEQKEAEATIREREEWLRIAIEAAGMTAWTLNPVTERFRVIACTDDWKTVLPDDEFSMQRAFDAMHPDDHEGARRALHEAMSSQLPTRLEMRLRDDNGSYRSTITAGRFVSTRLDRVPILFAVTMDLSALRAAEATIRESEERFRELANNIEDLFWIYDLPAECFIYLSPAFQDIFGFDTAQFDGTTSNWLQCVSPEDQSILAAAMARQFGGQATVTEFRVIRPDGSVRWVIDRAFPIVDSSGGVYRVVGITRDITDRVLVQERLALQQAELLHVSRLSTLGLMSTTLSHELNQPLSAIANFASACDVMLGREHLPDIEWLRECIRQINQQSLRAGEIVRRLRDFGRKAPDSRQLVNLNDIIQDTIALLDAELRWHSVIVTKDFEPNLPLIEADRIQLQQVFTNLLTNAADALASIPAASRRVTVRTNRTEQHVLAEVIDGGCGIAPEIRTKLFQPFVSSKPHGSGLGLSICQTILEAHCGELLVDDVWPQGTKFTVRLPILTSE